MRQDGTISYYVIEHETRDTHPQWVESDLALFLFSGLSYAERTGDVGNQYRRLLEPQDASTELWQRYGIHGYDHPADADRVLHVLRNKVPSTKFRLVLRTVSRTSEVVA